MKYKWKDLKKGKRLFIDNTNDYYKTNNDRLFCCFIILEIGDELEFDTGIKKESLRITIYPTRKEVYEDEFSKKYRSGTFERVLISFSEKEWSKNGWLTVNFISEKEMKRRIVKYSFYDY